MPQRVTKRLVLCLALVATTLTLLATAAASLLENGRSPAAATRPAASSGKSESARQAPCGSTTEGGPEGPPMQATDVCTTAPAPTGPVTEPAVQDPDRYAWRTFCELNRPAAGGGPGRVWQSWANQLDLFVSKPDPKNPPTWAQATGSTRRDRFQKRAELIAALASEGTESGGSASSSSSSSASSSPSSASTGGSGNLPQPRYDAQSCDPDTMQQVLLNRPQFDYVVANHLWYVEGQVAAYAAQKAIRFPTDATTVKAVWRPIAAADKPKYYWTESNGTLYGLASFLFMTKATPTWIWASFEHADNPCFGRYEAPEDSFGVVPGGPAGRPSLELLRMFRDFGLDPAIWSHYRLGGVQTSFTDDRGRPVLLGNSIAEAGFQTTSSCATCHGRSTVGPHTTGKFLGAGRLPIFGGRFYAGNARPQSSNGAPDPDLYYDLSASPPTLKYLQMDFAWSFACANEIGSDSNPCGGE